MTLILIPAGEFTMGSAAEEPGAEKNEWPSHRVRVTRPFYIGEKEVTVGQFRTFVEATGYRTTAETGGGGFMFSMKNRKIEQSPELTWRHPGTPGSQGEDEPVVQVSWKDAVAFCDWLTAREGRPFRLPTEAEWEYACRGRTATRWSFGDDVEQIGAYAWTLRDAAGSFHAVGSRRPNPFGLYDMHGNAWEWCQDWLADYAAAPAVDPVGRPTQGVRALRGGSFDWNDPSKTRSASRLSYEPHKSYLNYGFRVCSPERH